eukprot:c8426_g1_i2.p1 GENE.c8426_g1_i2~~c8426_g1_i2.p1  ORF type:complete len:408 (+),score=82.38 c8426_g1_i2:745-1968(+)
MDVSGYPTNLGTTFLAAVTDALPAAFDAMPVHRLRQNGAVIIGKTNMHELGAGTTGLNVHYGTPRNPHDTSRYTGGSSSGSAAAVAAGFVPIAIGADGGGSIRIPASLCGVVGLKPTFSRVPGHLHLPENTTTKHHKFELVWTVGHLGPIGASVDDVALAYWAIAGTDKISQPAVHFHGYNRFEDLSDLRVGYFEKFNEHSEPAIAKTVQQMIQRFSTRGAVVKPITIPHLDAIQKAHLVSIISEMATSLDVFWEHHSDEIGPEVRINLSMGRKLTARDLIAAQKVRSYAVKVMAELFGEVDVIVMPGTGVTAPVISPDSHDVGVSDVELATKIMRFSFLANLCGLPSIVVPVNYDESNMPISIQITASHWNEHILFRMGKAAEANRLQPLRQPKRSFSLLKAQQGN